MDTSSGENWNSQSRNWLDEQETHNQQPLSLMTIVNNTSAHKKEDLLTIRVLESSERKMQLIKKLLTPEEFNSLASNLFTSDHSTYENNQRALSLKETQRTSTPNDLRQREGRPVRFQKLGSSEANIRVPNEPNKLDLHENLAKKRKAVGFFFHDSTETTSNQQSVLAIKLQSGNNLRFNEEDEKRVLRKPSFSLLDRLIGIFSLFGISWNTNEMSKSKLLDDEIGKGFEIYLKGEFSSLPYTRVNNLIAMKRRMEADGQLSKIDFERRPTEYCVSNLKRQNVMLNSYPCNPNSKELECSSGLCSIKQVKSQPYTPVADINLLAYHKPVFERLMSISSGRKRLPNLVQQSSLLQLVELNLIQIQIKNHPLMLSEERLAIQVVENHQVFLKIGEKFESITTKILDSVKVLDKDSDYKNELKKMLDSWKLLQDELVQAKKKLLVTSNELERLRAEQKFNSSSVSVRIDIETDKNHDDYDDLPRASAFRSIVKKVYDLKEEVDLLDRLYSQALYENTVIEVNNLGINITEDNKCPVEEQSRRRLIREWFHSLQVTLLVGDNYKYDCKFTTSEDFKKFQFVSGTLLIPSYHGVGMKLTVEVYKNSRIYKNIALFSTLIARYGLELPITDSTKSYDFKIQLEKDSTDLNGEFEIYFQFELKRQIDHKNTQITKNFYLESFVDSLYDDTFKISHPFINYSTKLNRLLNNVDLGLILEALGVNSSRSSFFEMDPLADKLAETSLELREFVDYSKNWSRIRLLAWRWINNSNQTIYLNERENLKAFNFQVDEFKSYLRLPSLDSSLGYKLIEYTKAWASNYIREFERELLKGIEFEQEKSEQSKQEPRLTKLVKEPKLKMVNLSGAVRATRRMIPRRTTRRPLMPNRKGSKWATILGQHEFFSNQPRISGALDYEDLEAKKLGQQWQRLLLAPADEESALSCTDKSFNGPLQLVVSVQQASNVPMRIIQSQTGGRSRSNSPIVGPTSSPTSFVQQQISNYLLPATTYVEIIFQRKQQASSLAQGKNPQWNETLFFPVDLDAYSSTSIDTSQQLPQKSHLVDEFLQLNLYDYQYYPQDVAGIRGGATSTSLNQDFTSTLELLPTISGETFHSPGIQVSQRLMASHQKVERHLLGSLKIPLTTLMTTGRIEGSFSLTQPLLLENYQFDPLISLSQDFDPLNEEVKPDLSEQTRVSLFITLDPPISLPAHLYLPTGTIESQLVFEYARLWEQTATQYPQYHKVSSSSNSRNGPKLIRRNRHVRALVLQRDAKYCLIIRFLCPLEPPKSLLVSSKDDSNKQLILLARFVSLLCPNKHGLFNIRLLATNLWFDCKQLINMALGGPEEKAVLLCNYYSYLGRCSALLLGNSINEGCCIYVILWSEQTIERFLDNQLQLQATSLLHKDSVDQLMDDQTKILSNSQQPVGRHNFISKLPVLINAASIQLWDPIKGNCFTLSNQLPLISVGSIVTPENVYANIQASDSPIGINFDIRLRHLWLPLFEASTIQVNNNNSNLAFESGNYTSHKKPQQMNWRQKRAHLGQLRRLVGRPVIENAINNVNYSDFKYNSFSEQQCAEIKSIIEKTIKAQLLKWRPQRPTYFNRTLSRLISEKLSLFESYLPEQSNDNLHQKWKSELADLIKSEVLIAQLSSNGLYNRQVVSCPLNLPYTNMRSILDYVFASGVQDADLVLDSSSMTSNSLSSTQFLVACYVHPYPARVLSVWLYVGAIIPRSLQMRHLMT